MTSIAVKPMSIKLDEKTREKIEKLSKLRHRTAHWLMREAISQYVEREEKIEIFRQNGLQAWNEYQENGLHVTFEEADIWLTKLEEGHDVEPPKCHV